jgi:hypothetical protein
MTGGQHPPNLQEKKAAYNAMMHIFAWRPYFERSMLAGCLLVATKAADMGALLKRHDHSEVLAAMDQVGNAQPHSAGIPEGSRLQHLCMAVICIATACMLAGSSCQSHLRHRVAMAWHPSKPSTPDPGARALQLPGQVRRRHQGRVHDIRAAQGGERVVHPGGAAEE